MKMRSLIAIAVSIVIVYLAVFGVVFKMLLTNTQNAALAAVVGALAGALGGVMAAVLTALVAVWSRNIESTEQRRNLVSSHALELTRMDYDLRLRALNETMEEAHFLAPVKAYRELYKALLLLHETGEWTPKVQELGLLNVFKFDPAARERRAELAKELGLVTDFLGKPRENLMTLLHAGSTYDKKGRAELVKPIRDWVETNGPKLPQIEKTLRFLAGAVGSMIDEDGLRVLQTPEACQRMEDGLKEVEDHAQKLRQKRGPTPNRRVDPTE